MEIRQTFKLNRKIYWWDSIRLYVSYADVELTSINIHFDEACFRERASTASHYCLALIKREFNQKSLPECETARNSFGNLSNIAFYLSLLLCQTKKLSREFHYVKQTLLISIALREGIALSRSFGNFSGLPFRVFE